MRRTLLLAAAVLGAVSAPPAAAAPMLPLPVICGPGAPGAAPATPGAYYAIDLVSTRRVSGTSAAVGQASVTFAPSPFGIALAPDGEYRHALRIDIRGLRAARDGVYAVWATTPQLDDVRFLGLLDADGRVDGTVTFNKFIVVISLEDADSLGERWRGPIVLRGMSRSGRMHTMAGHGPFQAEPCLKYGY